MLTKLNKRKNGILITVCLIELCIYKLKGELSMNVRKLKAKRVEFGLSQKDLAKV